MRIITKLLFIVTLFFSIQCASENITWYKKWEILFKIRWQEKKMVI